MSETFEDAREAQKDPKTVCKRWLLEIKQADKREKDWRKLGESIFKRYRGQQAKKNSFNILWANTEVLRPALYNSLPKPDVRRRFRDADPLGKAVSELLERCLVYSVENGDFDECVKLDVLDNLLPGRGLSRIRYVPSIEKTGDEEALDFEQVKVEHVNWEDYRQGPAKVYAKLPWKGYRHQFTKDEVTERFGAEIADKLKYEVPKDDDLEKKNNEDLQQMFSTIEMWEIWDKETKTCFFVTEAYKDAPLYPIAYPNGEPEIKFKDFFDSPEPLRYIEDSSSSVPVPMFEEYREQADELDRISTRINKMVEAMKARGVYDATLGELSELIRTGGDGDMLPVAQAAAWMTNGGIEKAIWWMPVDKLAIVLKTLYEARAAAKETIYELSGISDIMRSATDPNETLGSQQIKASFGSMRLQRSQKDVQRYSRDLIRLMAEVIGEQFQQQTLQQMSGLNFPTNEMKAQVRQQIAMQQQAAMAQQNPQAMGGATSPPPAAPPIPPEMQQMLSMPSWEDIDGVLKSDFGREYRVDVETDSTVSATLQADMEGLTQVLTGLVEFWQGAGPAVMSGAVPIEAVKAISLTICRRAKLGMEVEDALDKIKQPQGGQASPEMQKAQEQMQDQQKQLQQQSEQIAQKGQALNDHESKLKDMQAQIEKDALEVKYQKQAMDMRESMEAELRQLRDVAKDAQDQAAAQKTLADIEKKIADYQHLVDGAETEQQLRKDAESQGEKVKSEADDKSVAAMKTVGDMHKEMMEQMAEAIKVMSADKVAVRDPKTGKVSGFKIASAK